MARRIIIALTVLASLTLGLAADAGARRLHAQPKKMHKARKLKKSSAPTITSVTPLKANVGEKLTILGSNLKRGKTTTRVFFLRDGGGITGADAELATKSRVVVTIPDTVTPLLRSGKTGARTRFQLRILTSRYGNTTKSRKSPLIGPASTDTGGGGGGGGDGKNGYPAPNGDCNHDGIPNRLQSDADGDLIPDKIEVTVTHTDPCNPDTDGDGVSDGFEWQSAKDLNNVTPFNVPDAALPYPGKKPWPNPLDPTDANIDHDGDGLTMADEYLLFKDYGHNTLPLNYSDGLQVSKFEPVPSDPTLQYMDMNHDGILSDDERDADGDHLGNWDEKYGRMTQDWWDSTYSGQNGNPKETRYPQTFQGTSMVDPDTNGNGVPDGADDQDHDGLSNSFEISRPLFWSWIYVSVGPSNPASGVPTVDQQPTIDTYNSSAAYPVVAPNPWARVQPFNPCKPVWSKTCHLHPPFGYYGENEDWAGMDPRNLNPPPAAPWLYTGEH
jgi:hypothetical protein